MTNWRQTAVVTSLAVAFFSLLAPQIGAHEKGVLKLATRRLAPGDSVATTGEHFSRRANLNIELVGIAGRTRLADVRTDSLGAFAASLVVPANLPVGSYRVVAVAADGDEVASVGVNVVARAATLISRQPPEEARPSARPHRNRPRPKRLGDRRRDHGHRGRVCRRRRTGAALSEGWARLTTWGTSFTRYARDAR